MNAANDQVDDLRDDHLRRALAHAPDLGAVPDWRLRKSIQRRAHDAIGATDPDTDSVELERAARTRWPWAWKAALATLLGVVLAGVLWLRAPAPAPRLEARITQEAPAPSAPPAPVAAPPEPTAPTSPPPPPPEPPPPAIPPPALPPPVAVAPPPAPPAPAVVPVPVVPATKAAPTVRTDETEPPTFEALSSWNRITIYRRGGESRSLTRAEARELNALLGSAALSAVGPRPLGGAPEWRITLELGNQQLALLEIAGSQVRWREGRTPPATGVPSAPALAALRQALQAALQPPEAAAPTEPPRNP